MAIVLPLTALLLLGQVGAASQIPLPEIERVDCSIIGEPMPKEPDGTPVGRAQVTLRNVRGVSLTTFAIGWKGLQRVGRANVSLEDRLLVPSSWIQPWGEFTSSGRCDLEPEVIAAAYGDGSIAGDSARLVEQWTVRLEGLREILGPRRKVSKNVLISVIEGAVAVLETATKSR